MSSNGSTTRLWHSCPDLVEDPNDYCPGGFYHISIGDRFGQDRYRVIHKLGYGSSSTVWLARDQGQNNTGRLVALKALRADHSLPTNHELAIQETLRAADPPIPHIQTVHDHFYVDGPNGTHLFIVYAFSGPSMEEMNNLAAVSDDAWRLRGDLARKIIKQVVEAVEGLHRSGIVHGDITCSNILFSLRPEVLEWSDTEVYDMLESPVTIDVTTEDGTPLPSDVPAVLTQPADFERLIDPPAMLLEESIVLTGFGHSYPIKNAVDGYKPPLASLLSCFAPETHFEQRAGFEADIWELGCAIYNIRAGRPLFDFCHPETILIQMVEMLGRLPDPWWGQFKSRDTFFLDDGTPRPTPDPEDSAEAISIREMLASIGLDDFDHANPPPKLSDSRGVDEFEVWSLSEDEEILFSNVAKLVPSHANGHENGQHANAHENGHENGRENGGLLKFNIGVDGPKPSGLSGSARPVFEKAGARLLVPEIKLLGNLLEKMLRYIPEERLKLHEVIRHPYLVACE